jgi:hypothetical protein
MATMQRICQQLALLHPPARRRVLAYVMARSETLPVLAAVGGGTESDEPGAPLFPDGPDGSEPPMMPPLHGGETRQ